MRTNAKEARDRSGRPRPLPVAQAQLAAELRTAPVTVVAQRYGLAPSTVNVWRQKWGIPRYTFRLARRGGRDLMHYLAALAAQPEGVSASQLATRLHITRQGMHWMLAKLEAAGYVHKRRPARASQTFLWSLTDVGLQRMTATQQEASQGYGPAEPRRQGIRGHSYCATALRGPFSPR